MIAMDVHHERSARRFSLNSRTVPSWRKKQRTGTTAKSIGANVRFRRRLLCWLGSASRSSAVMTHKVLTRGVPSHPRPGWNRQEPLASADGFGIAAGLNQISPLKRACLGCNPRAPFPPFSTLLAAPGSAGAHQECALQALIVALLLAPYRRPLLFVGRA